MFSGKATVTLLALLSLGCNLLAPSLAARMSSQTHADMVEQAELAEALADQESVLEDDEFETNSTAEEEEDSEEDEEEDIGNPPLCDKYIVRKECKVMDTVGNIKKVSISELSWVMSVKRSSLIPFLKSIGFSKAGEPQGQEDFSCQQLCEAVVVSIPEVSRPPASDMACRTGQSHEPPVVCDVDVSPEELADFDFDTNHSDFHNGHPVEDEEEEAADPDEPPYRPSEEELADLTARELTIRLANRFRIYPKLEIEVEEDVGDVELDDETHIEPPAGESSLAESNSTGYCSKSICKSVKDCSNYPYFAPVVEDARPATSLQVQLPTTHRGSTLSHRRLRAHGIIPRQRLAHTTTTPLQRRAHTTTTIQHQLQAHTTTTTQRQRRARTTTTTSQRQRRLQPPTPAPPPPRSSVPSWLADVEKVNIKAQAYVAHALQVAPKSKTLLKRWFGRSDPETVQKVMYVLNSLSGMLGNVAYKKGPRCSSNTYAYVYPRGPKSKNSKGEFVFFLCGVYFRSDLGEKIETITHEGSHHALAYTEDVCADASCTHKAYGRSTCQRLAREYPDRAIKNADSHCYFINDLNNHQR
eukprot:CAMPEP_0178400918 /NCGR_PEP_ID=MMETSP0689_2-20121128/16035_1 /TAXON_ID=160604 /ORGANISM="Amphidinium massartii, Strain CS-259" /LENGTH=583 /DNA_ID=CAMNT_0020021725 /DNA_START=74 /DNA_END=1825 /DNA_ORIENTATION=+